MQGEQFYSTYTFSFKSLLNSLGPCGYEDSQWILRNKGLKMMIIDPNLTICCVTPSVADSDSNFWAESTFR